MAETLPDVVYPSTIDRETGEFRTMTAEEYDALQKATYVRRKKVNAVNAPPKVETVFFRVYKTNWADVVCNQGLTLSQIGLFSALMAFADWSTNRIVDPDTRELLSIRSLAKLLGMDRKYISDVLHALAEKGFVALQQHGSTTYVLVNPYVMYFGKQMSNKAEHGAAFFRDNEIYHPVVYVDYREPRQK